MQAWMDLATDKERAPPTCSLLESKAHALDDIETYLVIFERVMQAHTITDYWITFHLVFVFQKIQAGLSFRQYSTGKHKVAHTSKMQLIENHPNNIKWDEKHTF